ncbi:MAG TPA: serine hydrolase domain-containing protein [Flavitalea sp.]|nr:serine hydrolase domain-containing protein [Flavitalea sp.]
MKRFHLSILLAFSACQLLAQPSKSTSIPDETGITINVNYSKAAILDSLMKQYTPSIMPGITMAVYSEAEGWWTGSQGYASLEKKVPMNSAHLQYLQSVSKMYMAVEILQLKERGKIDLDAPITKYLPFSYSKYIKNAKDITVRMLLNHTSGIREYNENPEFISDVIQHPLRNFSATDALKGLENEEPLSVPGAKYKYINTNYLLLSLIGNAITGDHVAFIKEHIFKPLGLNHTYYGNNYTYLKGLNLTQSYWDVFNNGIPVNITEFQQMTVVCSKGDDGIVCTTTDAVKFLKGLMEGKLLKPESMKEMFDFVKDEKGNKRYGMGVIYFNLGPTFAYGHGGGGVGAGCGLMYFPSHKLYTFFATNLGVFVESDLVKKVDGFRNALLGELLK